MKKLALVIAILCMSVTAILGGCSSSAGNTGKIKNAKDISDYILDKDTVSQEFTVTPTSLDTFKDYDAAMPIGEDAIGFLKGEVIKEGETPVAQKTTLSAYILSTGTTLTIEYTNELPKADDPATEDVREDMPTTTTYSPSDISTFNYSYFSSQKGPKDFVGIKAIKRVNTYDVDKNRYETETFYETYDVLGNKLAYDKEVETFNPISLAYGGQYSDVNVYFGNNSSIFYAVDEGGKITETDYDVTKGFPYEINGYGIKESRDGAKMVAYKDGAVVSTFTPEKEMAYGDERLSYGILDDGRFVIQFSYLLDIVADEYDYYEEGAKYDLVTYIWDIEKDKISEVDVNFLIRYIENKHIIANFAETYNTEKVDNIAEITSFENGFLDENDSLVVLSNKVKAEVKLNGYVDGQTTSVKAIGNGKYITSINGNASPTETVILDNKGKVVETYDYKGEWISKFKRVKDSIIDVNGNVKLTFGNKYDFVDIITDAYIVSETTKVDNKNVTTYYVYDGELKEIKSDKDGYTVADVEVVSYGLYQTHVSQIYKVVLVKDGAEINQYFDYKGNKLLEIEQANLKPGTAIDLFVAKYNYVGRDENVVLMWREINKGTDLESATDDTVEIKMAIINIAVNA